MTLCSAAVTDPVALGEVSATRDRPSNKQIVRVINNGLHASEAQDITSGSEFGMDNTSEEAACGKKAKKSNRPCKGKRERYKRFMERLNNDVMTAPYLMGAHSVAWPPSLHNDVQKKQWPGQVSATRDCPSNKQNVGVISNGLHASETQDSTSGSELGTVITSKEGAWGKKAKRNGKRERYRRFKEQLKNAVMTAPHLIDAHSVAWPPSLQKDVQKQQWLMMHLTMCKLQQLKIQGEPCMIDPVCSKPDFFL